MRKNRKTKKRKNVGGDAHIAPRKFIIIIILIIIAIFIYQENQKTIICIDAGHGGKDVRLCVNR